MSPANQNELIGKINHSNDLKKVKCRSVSVDKVSYVYVYMCIYICVLYINETMMVDCTIKDSTYV